MNAVFDRKTKFSFLLTLIWSIAIVVLVSSQNTFAQQETSDAEKDFATRLAKLDSLLEKERVKNKIPGMAIAIVKDDTMVFAKGYGHSDLENKKPVETDTLFAIGSSTKSFTATLVAMLVDEGKMSWDDPVTKYIPDFKMNVETGDQEITIRDLLCHRTGFTRMGLLWASGGLNRDEVIMQAAQAEAFAKFQEKFLYNNVMYMTAGVCAGRAVESDWDAMIAEKIFKPLGMNGSNTSINVAQKDPRLSKGYLWDEDRKNYVLLPMRNLDSIGPSGSINSNVTDMAQYIRFQLGKGKFDGQQLLGEKQLNETWSKQINVAGEVDYGMGWMLHEWNGKKVVEHGGNIDGFGAQVTLLPEESLGYVLLTNVTVTPLQAASINLVFDTLLGETKETAGIEGIDTDELLGKYIANFGPFSEQAMEVKMKDGALAIDVPGQTTYELKAPDTDGRWLFAVTDSIAIGFNRGDDGKIKSITMYQGGMEPEFIREGVELKPESPLNETAPLIGKYHDEKGKVDVEISVRNGRLVATAGNTGTFVFLPPDDEGKWSLRASPEMVKLQFNKNDDGTVKSVTRFQGGKEAEMMRVGEADAAKIPSVEELLATMAEASGIENADFKGVMMKGTAKFVHQGATGKIEMIFSADGKHTTRYDFGKMAVMVQTYDGEKGFSYSNVSRFEELKGRKLNLMTYQHPMWLAYDWKDDYTDVSITGEEEVDGEKTFVLAFSGENIPNRKLYVSQESGLVVKEQTVVPADSIGELVIDLIFSDYREVGGFKLPFKTVSENQFTGRSEIQYESAETLNDFPQDAFVVKQPDSK